MQPELGLFESSIGESGADIAGLGCRLHRLEVYNWGTFHDAVWTFEIDGRNALLTGDIGSGKSTLVDAVTTLLLPANRISYNKAAGADTRERDLRSYVLGHFKSEHNEETGGTRPVGLRGPGQYSVLLAVFGGGTTAPFVTLAQVFRAREDGGQPERFFAVADADLSITKHFAEPGDSLRDLRARLRDQGVEVHDHFPEYGRAFRRRLGIESEQALDLFHQTVSMKAVDNLNDFVRSHMLEPFDMSARVQSLITHFDDLTKAHDAVVRARHQLDLLDPLVAHLNDHDNLAASVANLDRQSGGLRYFFGERRQVLLATETERLASEQARLSEEIARADQAIEDHRDREQQLGSDIARNGGDRLATIEAELNRLGGDLPVKRAALVTYNTRLAAVGLDEVHDHEQFLATRAQLDGRSAELDDELANLDNRVIELGSNLTRLEEEAGSINAELRSLESRQSNLPRQSLVLRDELCSDLAIDGDGLPFVGELLQVRDDATDWEGAAERVLRAFALSLLVPNDHYAAVAEWINTRHLGTRLVYFRVPTRISQSRHPERPTTQPLLLDMIEVKPDSRFGSWLHNELAYRADHVCVESVTQFQSSHKAITRQGQVKSRDRHEKDDRRRIDDRRDFVLGWTNEQKIDALLGDASRVQDEIATAKQELDTPQKRRKVINQHLGDLRLLHERERWDELDWMATADRVRQLEDEAQHLRASSDALRALTAELDKTTGAREGVEAQRTGLHKQLGGVDSRHEDIQRQLLAVGQLLADIDQLVAAREVYEDIERSIPTDAQPDLTDLTRIAQAQDATRDAIATARTTLADRQQAMALRAVKAMREFRLSFAQEAAELDDNIASAAEYRELRDRVATDDLPRFEEEFRRSLKENTINEIAGLSAGLQSQANTIRQRVQRINDSLQAIDYNPGRYIRLVPEATPNTEVRQFQEDLRACTSNITQGADDDQYSEHRFTQVKAIIDRFKGREGSTDQDRSWTRRVTDVRQWFVFSASERWRDTDLEHESYSDSSGKSGGQKEKLAYTILAASLAYQFRLDRPDDAGSSFRFVVIDEAFGRGSDDSTRYALGLFTALGLQLLIVTPLQKIHVIEPFVSCVGFVQNPSGDRSMLQRLTIEEHRRGRADALQRRSRSSDSPAGSQAGPSDSWPL
jgi:uncharacterized protein YPO0396